MAYPKEIWVLFDLSNSGGEQKGQDSKNYLWWFKTKSLAAAFARNRFKTGGARLSRPRKFTAAS